MAAKPESNRRQFLSGRAALDAVTHLLPEADGGTTHQPSPNESKQAETYLIQIDRTVMACEFQILLNAGQHSGATEAALDAMDLVERLEDQLSWFRKSSELSRINRNAAKAPVAIERGLFELLAEAIRLSEETGGAFDISASPLWKLWGFHRRDGRVPSDAAIQGALTLTGSQQVQLDVDSQAIQFARQGVEINLGAIGKGYALDRCGEHLQMAGVDDFLIHGGQSSMLARGSRSNVAGNPSGWTVALRHPLKPDQRLAEIHLRDRALGTSGAGNQYFHVGGKRYGHVLDPRTGHPADTLLSATVLAPNGAQADALATAFFVMGLEASLEYCEQRPELGALLVASAAQAGAMELVSIGMEQSDWTQLA